MGKAINLIGKRFCRLVVVEKTEKRSQGSIVWKCRCDCGKETLVRSTKLLWGNTTSCGCGRAGNGIRHGYNIRDRKTREYSTWGNMIQRCTNPKNNRFKHYGGRGIKVCNRWRNSFVNFLHYLNRAGMYPKPIGMSIDRIDNNGNYEPGNIRWATSFQQIHNRRVV